MFKFLKEKTVPTFIVLFLFAMVVFLVLWLAITQGGEHNCSSSIDKQRQLEKQVRALQKEVRENTSADCCCCDSEFEPLVESRPYLLGVNLLDLHSNVSGTEFVYTNGSQSLTSPINGSVKEAKLGWSWGLQVFFGYEFGFENWLLGGDYLHMKSSRTTQVNSGTDTTLVPLKGTLVPTTLVGQAKSALDLSINGLDLLLDKRFLVFRNLQLNPKIGFQSLWLSIDQDSYYSQGGLGNDTLAVYDQSKFWGIGPLIGIDSRWFFCGGCYFSADITGKFPYGNFKVDYREYLNSDQQKGVRLHEQLHCFAPNVHFDIGLGYGCLLSDFHCEPLQLEISYWGDYYFHQNQIFQFVETSPPKFNRLGDDVSQHGLALKVAVQF